MDKQTQFTISEWADTTAATFETPAKKLAQLEQQINYLCELARYLGVPLFVAARTADDKVGHNTVVHLAFSDVARIPVEFLLAQSCIFTKGEEFAEQFNGLTYIDVERQARRTRLH